MNIHQSPSLLPDGCTISKQCTSVFGSAASLIVMPVAIFTAVVFAALTYIYSYSYSIHYSEQTMQFELSCIVVLSFRLDRRVHVLHACDSTIVYIACQCRHID